MTMAWILQAVGGGESIGVYIKDVKAEIVRLFEP